MKKKLKDVKSLWVNELSGILWALRTTHNFATKDTPITLAFGHEALIPAKIGVNTLKVFRYDTDDNDERLKENLDLIEEIRDKAQVRATTRRQQVPN